ncbi:MAG: CDP-alcohol phosphatidyltransferase [Elusimicrobia bacterium]|nr:MAG: CDP-alcohol phosphatidyltransferase [Elusimicrobiota bacterium]
MIESAQATPATATRFERLWATKNKDDEWWSSFVTSPIAIALNMVVVDWPILTPNRITVLSMLAGGVASFLIVKGGFYSFLWAVFFLHLSHIFDCMDGQMAKYRGISSPFGSYFDKVTDQLKVFLFFGAAAYAAYKQTGEVTPVFLGFIGVSFYFIRVYVKYLTIFIEMENDPEYLADCSAVAAKQRGTQKAHSSSRIWNGLLWFLGEQRKFFLFNETVFIFLISFGLLFDRLTEILWVFAVSQVYYGLRRSFQRGSQIYRSHHLDLLKPLEK